MRNFKRISRISIPVNLPRDIRVFCFNVALSIKRCGRFSFFVVKKVHEYRSIDENVLTLRLCSDSSSKVIPEVCSVVYSQLMEVKLISSHYM